MRKLTDIIINFIISFLGFGILFSLWQFLVYRSTAKALALGVSGGLLFAIGITIFTVITYRSLLKDTPQDCLNAEGANHLTDVEATGGILFFCKNEMLFRPHKMNAHKEDIVIPYADITDIYYGKFPRSIYFLLKDGTEQGFVVNHKKQIKRYVTEIRN